MNELLSDDAAVTMVPPHADARNGTSCESAGGQAPPRPRVYSPSQTEVFLQCPLKRELRYHDGLEPRRLGRAGLARILGTAFAAGVGAYNISRQLGAPPDVKACAGVAVETARAHLADADERGMVTSDSDMATRSQVLTRVERAITKYAAADPLPPTWQIVGVEESLPAHGNCRIDLAARTPQGLAVIDFKTKLTLDQKYFAKDIDRYRLSEQRWHYTWAYGEHTGERVHAFYIVVVVLEPTFRTHVVPFVSDDETQALWLSSRRETWRVMEEVDRGERVPWMAADHASVYGPCEYQAACFNAHLDTALMSNEFVPTQKREVTT